MNWLWPIKTGRTFFDVWSICHFAFWLVFGFNWGAVALRNKSEHAWWLPYVVAVVGALLWEVVEGQVFEPLGFVRHPEAWFNRWLSDPLVAVIAVLFALWLVRHQ